ncbi:hypothetical protein Tco_0215948 [Tanacetum coccineum]
MHKNLALIAKYFKKIYKPTNNNLRTSSNSRNKNVDNSPRKPKRVKDSTYHKEKMLLYKQDEKGVPLQVEQADWLEDTDEEIDKQELEAHYSFMAKIQEVLHPESNLTAEPLEHVQYDAKYNVFANERQHSEQPEFIELVDQAWEKHSHDHFRAPTAHDMKILIKTCLMPLAIKTQNDSFTFVHELKQEMHVNLKFDEIKEMTETSIANDTSGLVPQRQKASDYDNSGPVPQLQNVSSSADTTVLVNNSSSPTDNSKQQDTPPTTNIQSSTEPTNLTNVNAEENKDNQAEHTQFQQDEFINPFCTPVREIAESSARNIDNSNMHTFYQPHDSEYRWIKDHPLEQLHGNPSKPVQTR